MYVTIIHAGVYHMYIHVCDVCIKVCIYACRYITRIIIYMYLDV